MTSEREFTKHEPLESDYYELGKLGSQLKDLTDMLYECVTERDMHSARAISLELANKTLQLYIKLGEIIQKDRTRPPVDPQLPLDYR